MRDQRQLKERRQRIALVIAVSAVVVWVSLWQNDVNPVDFLVYRYASTSALHGDNIFLANLDGPMMPQGGMPFVYGPIAALLFWPTTLLGWHSAYVAWSMLNVLSLAWVLHVFTPRELRHNRVLVPSLVAIASLTCVVFGHLKFGQVNLLLMAACVFDLVRRDDSRLGRTLPRGVLVGVAAAVKLTPAVFIVFFALSRQWRLARASAAAALGATIAGAVLFPSMSHTYWTHTVWHLSDSVELGRGLGQSYNSSIQGAFAAIGDWTRPIALLTVVVVAVVALRAAIAAHERGRTADAWLIIGLAAPLLSPVSWPHHWVFVLPALATVALRTRRLTMFAAVGAATALVILGPNPSMAVFRSGIWVAWPAGVLLRECLIVVSCLLIAALHWSERMRMSPLSSPRGDTRHAQDLTPRK